MELALFVIVYALLNRMAGAGDLFRGVGRSIYVVAPAAGIAAGVITGSAWFAGVITLCWALYRVPGWYGALDMGHNEGKLSRDWFVMSLAHTRFVGPLAFFFYYYTEMTPTEMIEPMLTSAAIAFFLGGISYLLGWMLWSAVRERAPKLDPIRYAEFFAGASLGLVTLYAWSAHLIHLNLNL